MVSQTSLILVRQNEPLQIKRLRAQRHIYGHAKLILALQSVMVVAIPALGALFVIYRPEWKATLAFYGISIAILDSVVLEPLHKRLRRRAAKIQEAFDCYVLELPWDKTHIGSPVEEEDIHSASTAHHRGRPDDQLLNWYPAAIAEIRLPLGRIICQRANLRWDADLRRRCRFALASLLFILSIGISWAGLQGGTTLELLTLGVLAPLAPILLWGIREFQKHGEAAETTERLREKSNDLWKKALEEKLSDTDLLSQSRQLQSEIYDRRSSAPMIFDWIYKLLRSRLEDQMSVAAEELVSQAKSSSVSRP
ncbi:MAG: S-4TM family putative pore-forming effector [Thermoanaerobaculia bacterium]